MMKIKCNHKCKSLRELEKIVRKYAKFVPLKKWYSWEIYYSVYEDELKSEKFIKYASKRTNLEDIRKEALAALSEKFYITFRNEKYNFVGIQITNEDYYWLYSNGTKFYMASCVGKIAGWSSGSSLGS